MLIKINRKCKENFEKYGVIFCFIQIMHKIAKFIKSCTQLKMTDALFEKIRYRRNPFRASVI